MLQSSSRGSLKSSTDPYEAMQSSNGSLAKFFMNRRTNKRDDITLFDGICCV